MRLLLATTNEGKLREIRDLLAGLPIEWATLADLPRLPPPDETEPSFEGNARLKARYYAERTGWTVVAEDSGLEIDALGGAPGVQSARFGRVHMSYPERFQLINEALAKVPESPRSARFVCALAVADDDAVIFEARGTVEGEIAAAARGEGGFGYDPIFYYPPFGCTFAEAGTRKSSVSHRGRAFRNLKRWLTERLVLAGE
jgi:XTP/dITP diphosphohydrolase